MAQRESVRPKCLLHQRVMLTMMTRAPHYRRATAIGFQQAIGNTAGIVAGQIYRKSPFTLGNAFSLGTICFSCLVILFKMWYIRSCSRKKAAIAAGQVDDTRKVKTGDWALDFEYHL